MPESSNRLGGGPGRRVLRARRASKNLACTPIKEDAQFALLPVTYAHSHGSAGRLEDFKVAICKSSRGIGLQRDRDSHLARSSRMNSSVSAIVKAKLFAFAALTTMYGS